MKKTINADHFLKTLREQVQFGDTADGGVSRPALSPEDAAIREWFRSTIEADNFECKFDGAGNQSAIWRSRVPHAKTLLIGSHLDSVRNGGRFDGVLGVLAAYEGHDSQSLAGFTETVMLFIPSEQGISHNPREFSSAEDCVDGANVLLHAVLELAAVESAHRSDANCNSSSF